MLLGIDLGTSSVKALLMAIDGTPISSSDPQGVAQSSHPYPVNAPHPGWAETNPNDWWSAMAIAVRNAVQNRGSQIQAGLSGQMHRVVLSDANGQPLYPAILWADTRASELVYRYQAILDLQPRLANLITTRMEIKKQVIY